MTEVIDSQMGSEAKVVCHGESEHAQAPPGSQHREGGGDRRFTDPALPADEKQTAFEHVQSELGRSGIRRTRCSSSTAHSAAPIKLKSM